MTSNLKASIYNSSSLYDYTTMEKELLYWSRWNYAVASFCQDLALEDTSTASLVELFVGEGAEWIGYPAIGFALNQAAITTSKCDQLKRQIEELRNERIQLLENTQATKLQNQVVAAEFRDREWKLLETIAELQEQIRRQQKEIDQQDKDTSLRIPLGNSLNTKVEVDQPISAIMPHSIDLNKSTTENSKQHAVSMIKLRESLLLQDLSNSSGLFDGKENRKVENLSLANASNLRPVLTSRIC